MERFPVESEALASVGYDIFRHILQIEFTSGDIYNYMEVPERIYEDLMNSDSHGAYFQANIRDQYDYIKIR